MKMGMNKKPDNKSYLYGFVAGFLLISFNKRMQE